MHMQLFLVFTEYSDNAAAGSAPSPLSGASPSSRLYQRLDTPTQQQQQFGSAAGGGPSSDLLLKAIVLMLVFLFCANSLLVYQVIQCLKN